MSYGPICIVSAMMLNDQMSFDLVSIWPNANACPSTKIGLTHLPGGYLMPGRVKSGGLDINLRIAEFWGICRNPTFVTLRIFHKVWVSYKFQNEIWKLLHIKLFINRGFWGFYQCQKYSNCYSLHCSQISGCGIWRNFDARKLCLVLREFRRNPTLTLYYFCDELRLSIWNMLQKSH